jgi:hypothetical protein
MGRELGAIIYQWVGIIGYEIYQWVGNIIAPNSLPIVISQLLIPYSLIYRSS